MGIFNRKNQKPLPPPEPEADKPRPPVGPKSDNIPFEGEPDAPNN